MSRREPLLSSMMSAERLFHLNVELLPGEERMLKAFFGSIWDLKSSDSNKSADNYVLPIGFIYWVIAIMNVSEVLNTERKPISHSGYG